MSFFEEQEQRINKQFISIFDSVYFVSEHAKGTLQKSYDFIVSTLLRKQTYLLLVTSHSVKTVYVCSDNEHSQYEPFITFESIAYELKECIDRECIGVGNPIYNLGFAKKRFVEQLVSLGMKIDEQIICNTESPDIADADYSDESDQFAFYNQLPEEYNILRLAYDKLQLKHEKLKHENGKLYGKKVMPEKILELQMESAKKSIEAGKKAEKRAFEAERKLELLKSDYENIKKKYEAEKKNKQDIIKLHDYRLSKNTENNCSQTTSNSLYDWQSMHAFTYPPELHLAMLIWEEYYDVEELKDISQFNSSKFNRVSTNLGLHDSNLKGRIRTILTPIQRKKTTDNLIEAFEGIDFIHSDKVINK